VFTLLAAIGIILTPIYLLSMLRQVFYGSKGGSITHSRSLIDAGPREIFVVVCLMIPMIGLVFTRNGDPDLRSKNKCCG